MHSLVAAEPVPHLPPFTFSTVFTHWEVDPFLTVITVWAVGLYLFGVWLLHSRGDRWPVVRTLNFVVFGMGSLYFATSSGLGAYDTTLLSHTMVPTLTVEGRS